MCNNWGTHEMRKFDNVNELVNTLKPDNPVYCIRPKSIKKSVEFFKKNFPGKILYAVKTNPNESCLLYTSPSPRDRTRSRMPSSA